MATNAVEFVELPKYSAFSATPIYKVGGDIIFGLLQEPVIADPSDKVYVVNLESRLDALSQQFYGTPELWWVIAMVNDLVDVHIPVPTKTRLRIPSQARLSALQILK